MVEKFFVLYILLYSVRNIIICIMYFMLWYYVLRIVRFMNKVCRLTPKVLGGLN